MYLTSGKLNDAKNLFEKSNNIAMKYYGEDNPKLIAMYANMGN